MHEQQISADGDDRGSGQRDHAGGKLVNPGGDGVPRLRQLLQARELQQMVVGRALLVVAENIVGADDLPELQRGFGIVRSDVGMGAFDGPSATGNKKLIGAGRVQLDFWDPEGGYYLNGTYYGAKNLLAVGIAGQVQGSDGSAWNADFRIVVSCASMSPSVMSSKSARSSSLKGRPARLL